MKQKRKREIRQIVVIGGGAAGLLAAIAAAEDGAQVTILEHKEQLGKKILSTGNGRCNLGNRRMEPDCYHSRQQAFPWKVLRQFGLEENIRFWEKLGMVIKDKNGYLYPWSESAAAVAELLQQEIHRLGVEVITECHVSAVRAAGVVESAKPTEAAWRPSVQEKRKKGNIWAVSTDRGEFLCERVILAAGSKAASVLGSDGSGYDIAEKLGYSLVPVLPALVQLRCQGTFFKAWSGVRTEAKVTLFVDGVQAACDAGEVQLTDYGVSGIPVFQVSRFAAIGLYQGKKVEAVLDFLPFLEGEQRKKDWFSKRLAQLSGKTAEEFLCSVLHKKLIGVLLRCAKIQPDMPVAEIGKSTLEKLYQVLSAFRLTVTETNSFEQAQVCCGGVDVRQVDAQTLESKLHRGLYFAGEILDVDGICGGYNLQWAFSSGSVAGKAAAASFRE
ncbi:MAG: aminoacetone oxidase family FAD-binding enzyme [bacterium]|nr:aminoacetone oxidase family FAD-binding enzyme [bacterium]